LNELRCLSNSVNSLISQSMRYKLIGIYKTIADYIKDRLDV